MDNRFSNLMNRILELDHTEEEWNDLRKEFNELITCATENEIQEFTDSGAGEALFMATDAY